MKEPTHEAQAERVLSGAPLPFAVGGQRFYIRQPYDHEIDDARAVQKAYELLWRSRPEVRALEDVPADAAELAGFDRAIAAAKDLLKAAEGPAAEALKRRISALKRRREAWSAADQVATDRGLLARDRWLLPRLLLNQDGDPVADPQAPEFADVWQRVPLAVKDGARPGIWQALRLVEDVRFT